MDLTVTLAVLAVAATFSLVRGREWVAAYELRNAAVLLAAECSAARSAAIASGGTVALKIGERRDRYGMSPLGHAPVRWTVLVRGIRFESVPGREIRFYPRGNAAPAGTLLLSSEAGAARVVVAPMGRIRWEWGRP